MTLDVAATDTEVRVILQVFLVSGIGFGWPQILVAGLPLVLDQICALLVGILRTWVHQVSPCNYQVFHTSPGISMISGVWRSWFLLKTFKFFLFTGISFLSISDMHR